MQHTPIGVIAIVCLVFMGLALAKKQGDADRAYETAKQEYNQTKSVAPLGALPKRSQTDPKSYREEWRNEQDLAAQRDMANWAWWMLIATSASTIVTGVGIYFVAETLRANLAAVAEAAKANAIARRVGQAQVRAYVTIDGIELHPDPPDKGVLTVRVIFKNAGQSPALNLRGENCCAIAASDGKSIRLPRPKPMDRPSISTLQAGGKHFTVTSTTGTPPFKDVYQALNEGKCEFYVWGWVQYLDVFKRERETTYQWFIDKASLQSGIGFRADDVGNEET